MQASAATRMSSPDAAKTMIGSRVPLSIQRGKSKNDVARPLTARGMHREWRGAMPKDLAQVDYVREFIDLLEKNAPTVKRPTLLRGVRPPFPERLGGPASRWRRRVAGTIPCVQAFVELLAKFAPPENARHELGSSHRHDRKRRRGAKA